MTGKRSHIIQKLNLEISVVSEKQGQQIVQNSTDFVQQKLLPILNDIFEKIGKDIHLRLDTLDISIDTTEDQYSEQIIVQKIGRAIQKKLLEAETKSDSILPSRSSKAGNNWTTFLFFLENGSVPWWLKSLNIKELQEELSNDISNSIQLKALEELLLINEKAIDRLIFQFDQRFIQGILTQLNQVNFPSVTLFNLLEKVFSNENNQQRISNQISKQAVKIILSKNTPPQDYEKEWISQLVLFFSKKGINQKNKPDALSFIEKINKELVKSKLSLQPSATKFLKNPFFPRREKVKTPVVNTPSKGETTIIDTEGIYIENAGLVILHPFFQFLFSDFGWIKNNAFTNIESQKQAALLLQYLVSNNTQSIESDLLLNKILCDIDLTEPLERKLFLSKKMATESKNLLQATIKHWSALKNTSPEGLQNTFLQREGKLTQKENGDWLLKIQTTGFDILIAQLPWSISMIKLPWMKNMLYVEWA